MSELRDDLKAFVDGELSASRMAEVRDAVAADPALTREVEFMKMLSQEIKSAAVEPAPHGLAETLAAVRGTMPTAKPATPRRAPWWHPTSRVGQFAYAGALLAVLVGVGSLMRQQSLGPTESAFAGAEPKSMEGAMPMERGMPMDEMAMTESPAPSAAAPSGGTLNFKQVVPESARTSASSARAGVVVTPSSLRLILKNGIVRVRVDSAAKAQAEAMRLAEGLGGFVESSSLSGADARLPASNVVMRVPSNQFDAAMNRISAMGNVIERSANAQDVTAQVADVEARLKVMRAEEESYITLLRAARRVGEMLEIRERLGMVRQEIESLDAQRRVLRDQASLSTINASFEQRLASEPAERDARKGWAEEAWASAGNMLSGAGRFLGESAIWLFVMSPIWLPPVLLFWWLSRRASKRSN